MLLLHLVRMFFPFIFASILWYVVKNEAQGRLSSSGVWMPFLFVVSYLFVLFYIAMCGLYIAGVFHITAFLSDWPLSEIIGLEISTVISCLLAVFLLVIVRKH